MMSAFKLVCLLFLTLSSVSSLKYESSSGSSDFEENSLGLTICETAQGGQGVCVHIYECPNYKELIIARTKPRICNWAGRVPVICCPTIPRRVSTSTPDPDYPVEVTSENVRVKKAQGLSGIENCGTRRANVKNVGRIVGGDVAYEGEFPWDVAIFTRQLDGSINHECGGSIISDYYILTAAHCFENTDPSAYLIGIGSNDLTTTRKYEIEAIKLHPDYSTHQFYNDVALVRTQERIDFSETVRPICLPNDRMLTDSLSPQDTVTISGWGFTEYNGERSRILLKADLNLMPREACNQTYARLESRRISRGITDDFICAGTADGKKDACQSDSGGPLVVKSNETASDSTNQPQQSGWESQFIQVGIVSFGYKCGVRGWPGVYTNVAKYVPWIREQVDFKRSSVPDMGSD